MERLGVLTSGGDSPGMNAAIRATVRMCHYHDVEIFGIRRGYSGLIQGDFFQMDLGSVADIIHRGGTILHTARCEEFKSDEGQKKALTAIEQAGLDGLLVIGGDGSLRGAMTLFNHGVEVIGIPATIDNDVAGTDAAIGFDTAVNTAVEALNKIRDTATSHGRSFVVEVMGRDSGAIALDVGVAGGAESILIPEVKTDLDRVAERVLRGYRRGKVHSIIVVAEGVASGFEIGREIDRRTGLETRVVVLGYIQRGGTPTAKDRIRASRMAGKAVELLLSGDGNGKMIGMNGEKLHALPIREALAQEQEFNESMFDLAAILAI